MSIDNATPSDWYRVQQLEPINLHNVDQAFDRAASVDIKTLGDYIKSKQIGGDHYKSNIEPWDVFLDWGLDPWACNVIKYVARHRKKAGKQDLEKAKHYLEFMIANYDKVGDKYYKV
jgi:hypothetical protein